LIQQNNITVTWQTMGRTCSSDGAHKECIHNFGGGSLLENNLLESRQGEERLAF